MQMHKWHQHPWQGWEEHAGHREAFLREVDALEAQGWVMVPDSHEVTSGAEDVPWDSVRISCVLLSPDDPETPALRAQRPDLNAPHAEVTHASVEM